MMNNLNHKIKCFCVVICLIVVKISAFGQITLSECQKWAFENYPLIRQYLINERLEQFSVSNAAKAYMPSITISGYANYQSSVPEFPEDMEQIFQNFGMDFKGLSHDQYRFMLQIDQILWDGGYSKSQKEIEKAKTKAANLSVDKELESIKRSVNQIYFAILMMESNIEINNYADTLLHNNLKNVESGISNGTAMQSDLDNISVEIMLLEQQQIKLKSTISLYRKMLSLMVGKEISEFEPVIKPPLPDINRNENNRSELKLFDANSDLFTIKEKVINSTVMPHFSVFFQGWYGRPGLNLFNDMQYNEFSWNYIIGIRCQWNTSGFYTKKNNLNKLRAQSQSFQIQKELFLWNFQIQQSQIESEIFKIKELQEKDDRIVALRQSIRKTSESKFNNGVITAADLLRDIINEKNAIIASSMRELELLKEIYDLKYMLNQ